MNEFWEHFLPREETARISKLEMFDEEEEIKVKCAHYFILHASKKGSDSQLQPLPPRRDSIDQSTETAAKWSTAIKTRGKTGSAARWGHRCALFTGILTILQCSLIRKEYNSIWWLWWISPQPIE